MGKLNNYLSRYHCLEARQTSKPQNRRPLFDIEPYLAVHKSFASSSLNITHGGCTFHLSYPYWTITSFYENTMSSITVTVHKLAQTLTKTSNNYLCVVAIRPYLARLWLQWESNPWTLAVLCIPMFRNWATRSFRVRSLQDQNNSKTFKDFFCLFSKTFQRPLRAISSRKIASVSTIFTQ